MPRGLEVIAALAAAAVLSPVMLLAALLNRLLTGRVFFRQTRVGRGLRPFTILKFQTMVDAAEYGTSITAGGDPRITAFGRVLRAAKLDELPQLWNVLRGEMSLVGPRALTPNEVARIPPEVAAEVYAARPGMTGLASLALVDEEQILAAAADADAYYFEVVLPQKMAWEVVYARRRSAWVDLLILAATPAAIVMPSAVRWAIHRWAGGSSVLRLQPRREERA